MQGVTHWYVGPLDRMGISHPVPACAQPSLSIEVTADPGDVTCLRCRDTQRFKKATKALRTVRGASSRRETTC